MVGAALAALALLVAWVLAVDADPSGALRGERRDGGLWVLTYNVNFERPSEETVAAIVDADADLVFLQETHEGWRAMLDEALGERYPHALYRHADAEGGLAVLSRYPLLQRAHGRAPGAPFPAWSGTVETPLGELLVLHVHLHPPLDEEGSLLTGYFTTSEARLDELAHHIESLEAPPDLVLGDFNEAEGSAVTHLVELGLREAQAAHPPVERTWTWETSLGEMTGRPDHIFVDRRFDVAAVQMMEQGASDHRPLRVQLLR